MQARFLLGPAGSGKTFCCLAEIRAALAVAPDGPPLILLAPKQATFQLERQLLADDSLEGYTRLRILSFEGLARFVFDALRLEAPRLLNDEGRLMVLRTLLAQKQGELKLFRAAARLPGFAQQLSLTLRELQHCQFTPNRLIALTTEGRVRAELQAKLHDLALLLAAYLQWLDDHDLKHADVLPGLAVEALMGNLKSEVRSSNSGVEPRDRGRAPDAEQSAVGHQPLAIAGLWLDGFAEMTPQELDLLAALLPRCERATLAFCLEAEPTAEVAWPSIWSVAGRTFRESHGQLAALPGVQTTVEILPRDAARGRFAGNPVFQHLEAAWARQSAKSEVRSQKSEAEATAVARTDFANPAPDSALRVVVCANPDAEATLAAQEILRFVQTDGRYRDAAILVRDLDACHHALERALRRYGIPFFLDRRESVSHHPLAELTRSALRTVAFDWLQEDWFGALKAGFAPVDEAEIDWLENEGLARGWQGTKWREPIQITGELNQTKSLERLRQRLVPPYDRLATTLARQQNKPTGMQLAAAIRDLWDQLNVEKILEQWSGVFPESLPVAHRPSPIHLTVWEQMNAWLDNVELAFPRETLPLRAWLPILEAGLGNLTVGVIPPVLDQVLVGAIDRSRNPDLKLAIVLGLNEGIFPAPPASGSILTETDRDDLNERLDTPLGRDLRERIARERYYGYIACTRARERLVLACSEQDGAGQMLNPSPFIAHLQRLFPSLKEERFAGTPDWRKARHVSELVPPLLRGEIAGSGRVESLPEIVPVLDRWRRWQALPGPEQLALPAVAVDALYGSELRTSISALEMFAACPFQFFARYGLRADERELFEADPRQTGSFQHEILSRFHQELAAEGKRWRDLTPRQARDNIARIGAALAVTFEGGLFQADAKSRFLARTLVEQLQSFIEVVIGWMGQYEFDPRVVELSFGLREDELPAWKLDLDHGRSLLLRGKIDRVDLCREPGTDAALAVVLDYKSGGAKLDPVLLQHGLELQLLSYLGVLRRLSNPKGVFGAGQLVPAGVFYVPLRARATSGGTRIEVLDESKDEARREYQHTGRFDAAALAKLDNRGETKGTQFKYSINQNGEFSKTGNEAMPSAEFRRLLDANEDHLRRHGSAIFAGTAAATPYRKGNERACDWCVFQTVCRFDAWANPFRVLRKPPIPNSDTAPAPKQKRGKA